MIPLSMFCFTSDWELPNVLHCPVRGFADYVYTPLCLPYFTLLYFMSLLDPLVLEMFTRLRPSLCIKRMSYPLFSVWLLSFT